MLVEWFLILHWKGMVAIQTQDKQSCVKALALNENDWEYARRCVSTDGQIISDDDVEK